MNDIDPCLVQAVLDATADDLQFSKHPIVGHSLKREEKIGFLVQSIKGIPFSNMLKISYVCGNDGEEYFYVVSQIDQKEILVRSEMEARNIVLSKLKSFARAYVIEKSSGGV